MHRIPMSPVTLSDLEGHLSYCKPVCMQILEQNCSMHWPQCAHWWNTSARIFTVKTGKYHGLTYWAVQIITGSTKTADWHKKLQSNLAESLILTWRRAGTWLPLSSVQWVLWTGAESQYLATTTHKALCHQEQYWAAIRGDNKRYPDAQGWRLPLSVK